MKREMCQSCLRDLAIESSGRRGAKLPFETHNGIFQDLNKRKKQPIAPLSFTGTSDAQQQSDGPPTSSAHQMFLSGLRGGAGAGQSVIVWVIKV